MQTDGLGTLLTVFARANSEQHKENYMRFFMTLLACLISLSVSAEQWIYKDIIDQERVIRIETNPDNMAVDGKMSSATFCAADAEYICIRADDFSFHFPKYISSSTRSWSVDGCSYSVSSHHHASYFGVKYEVYVVTKDIGNGTIYYLYSKEGGLLGIGGKGADTSTMYLVDSKCGYGASLTCE